MIGFVMKWCLVPQVRVPLLARRTPHKWAVEACIIADGTGLVVEAVCSFGTEGTTEKVETRREHRNSMLLVHVIACYMYLVEEVRN